MANRVAIADGLAPLAEKRRANTPTFRAAALATFEANRPRWRSARTARAWLQSLEKHAFPEIGGERFVFPSPVGRASPLGESSLLQILRKADVAARITVRGFRSSFRS